MALHPTLPVAYVAYELTSLVAAFEVDAATGRLADTPLPPGPVCVLDTRGAAEAAAARVAPQSPESKPSLTPPRVTLPEGCAFAAPDPPGTYAHLLAGDRCSDAATSIAACRVAPDGRHLFVSNRVVDGEGAISALQLEPNGQLLDPKGAEGAASFAGTRDRTPRDFVLLRAGSDGAPLLLAANQDSHTLYAVPLAACAACAACPAGGGTRLVAKVPSPVCIAVPPEDVVERAS